MIDDLKFSGQNPVVINYNGSASDVLAPVKSSSCDINIVSPHILDDLYTAEKDRVVVQVKHKEYYISENFISHPGSCTYTGEFAFLVRLKGTSEMPKKVHVSSVLNYFKDIDGVWNFIGYIYNGGYQTLIAYYDNKLGIWIEENKWNLGVENTFRQIYFHDGVFSYKIDNTTNPSEIYTFYDQGRDWEYHSDLVDQFGNKINYGDLGSMLFYKDGKPGLLFQEKWWMWDSSREMFLSMPDLQFQNQNLYYGKDIRKVWSRGEMVTVIPTNYNNPETGYYGRAYVKFNDDGEIEYVCDIPEVLSTIYMWSDEDDNIFSMTEENIYCLVVDKESNSNRWIRVGSVQLHQEPTMAIGNKMYMSTYNGGGMVEVTQLPWLEDKSEKIYSDELLWEGYMTPNTYSQELTQNLDQISLTAIDPVAMMKYVKIDSILTKPNVLSYEQLIGKALAYVALDKREIFIENNFKYDGEYGLLDMRCQVSNFWDEGGEPATLYEMIEELLRPFCLTLSFGKRGYYIIDASSTSETRKGKTYYITDNGELNPQTSEEVAAEINPKVYDKLLWKSNNVSSTDMTISSTYDKVTGVASTSIPSYSTMAFDLVDSNNRDMYDAGWLNVDRNKAKGFVSGKGLSTDPDWFYLWNGVYTNPNYKLESYNGYVNGWLNINKAYQYLSGESGHPNDSGSILNFYGGSLNPTGTGKEQTKEKSVEIKKRITAYAPDNGIPPEFMERKHIHWKYSRGWDPENIPDPEIVLTYTGSDAPYGEVKGQVASNKIVYRQNYENMSLDSEAEQVIDFSLTHSYSRTGIDTLIPKLNSTIIENRGFFCWPDTSGEGGNEDYYMLNAGDVYAIPWMWDSDKVIADYPWAGSYSTSGKCLPIWDKRMIMMYIQLESPDESGYTYYQFNGKDWVGTTYLTTSNAFYLKKLMNYNRVFHNDIKYNIIECSDGTSYSLKDERIIFYKDRYGGVVQKSVTGGSSESFPIYYSQSNEWFKWLKSVGEGELSVIIPEISAINACVVVDVYNSTLLGSTLGNNGISGGYADSATYKIEGNDPATYIDPDGDYGTSTIGARCPSAVGTITSTPVSSNWNGMPPCVSYFKAEHLDLSIEVTVPESNLGQMFSESDVKYTIDRKKNYLEEYEGPTFKVNTAHPLVKTSFSYLICNDEIADPEKFVFKNRIATRPECYVVQAYMNLLSKIRKVYNKTIKLLKNYEWCNFGNTATYIDSPEIEKKMMVLGSSYDVKTNRHTIEAIEDYGMDVTEVESFATVEIPRKARNSLFNLPSAKK